MIDLETLSLEHNAVIASIAAVEFGNETTDREFHIKVDVEDCEKYGMHISASTVVFWMGQDRSVQTELTSSGRYSLASALEQFSEWLTIDGLIEEFSIWALGDKDVPWLENAYKVTDIPIPWHYRNVYNYRVLNRFSIQEDYPPSNDMSHQSLADCRWQIKFVQNFCKRNKLNLEEVFG